MDSVPGPVQVELGFRYIVPWTYPNLTALLCAIGVAPRQNVASMSFRGLDSGPTISVPPAPMTQGSHLAGMYTCDVDNHESATTSAVHLAARL